MIWSRAWHEHISSSTSMSWEIPDKTYQSFPCTFANWCWSFRLLGKIDWRRFDHSTSNIMMYIFGDLKYSTFINTIILLHILILPVDNWPPISSWVKLPQTQIWTFYPQPLISLARIILGLIRFDCPAWPKIAVLFNQKSLTRQAIETRIKNGSAIF